MIEFLLHYRTGSYALIEYTYITNTYAQTFHFKCFNVHVFVTINRTVINMQSLLQILNVNRGCFVT